MKKAFTLVSFVAFLLSTEAQISFLSTDAPTAGTTQKIVTDTLPLPSVSYGNKGANQTYDFSNLVQYKTDTIEYRLRNASQQTNFPNADVATTLDGVNFLLTRNTNAQLTLEGFDGLFNGNSLWATYSTQPIVYKFPTTYNSNFTGTSYLQKTVPASQVGVPLYSQVRLTISSTYSDTTDGWGKVITPVGTYKCLRIKRTETTTTQTEGFLFSWSNILPTTVKTTVRYSYLTKETKGSAVTFDYDSLDNLRSVTYSQIPPNAPLADFSFANGSAGLVNFTDLSDNYPTSWSWNFGDGGTSTQQNPSHTYAANGTYTVCLIATNAGGSSTQVCKQVTVSNIVIQPVANFSWVNPSGGLVNFTDLSTNTPTSWLWNFGDASPTSTSQNPNHIYAANNTYNVCLTATNTAGSNQVCKNVVVTGISGGGNNKPVALDDTVSLAQGTSITIFHVATNDADPDGDNICMTSVWGSPYVTEYIGGACDMVTIAPDTNFVGTDTAYYSLCDDGTPVLCDTGMIIFTVYGVNHAPVAVNDNFTVLQATGTVQILTGNDSDPDANNVCVTSVWGTPSVMVNAGGACNDVFYISDTCFSGQQTFYYSLCDDGSPVLCDTAEVTVTVTPNTDYVTSAYFDANAATYNCVTIEVPNASQNYLSSSWQVLEFSSGTPTTYTTTDLTHQVASLNFFDGQICLTATGKCGNDNFCDTILLTCIGISENNVTEIKCYPNPAKTQLTIDMSNNTDAAVLNYKSIEICNALGVRVVGDNTNHGKLVNVSVADLPAGMYVATLTDANGIRKTLGRFVKE